MPKEHLVMACNTERSASNYAKAISAAYRLVRGFGWCVFKIES